MFILTILLYRILFIFFIIYIEIKLAKFSRKGRSLIMKKILKCFTSLAVLFGLCSFGFVHVHAEDNSEIQTASTIIPFARVCTCGGSYYLASTSYSAWYTSSEVKCNSHTYGTDLIQKRTVTKTYKCNSCGKGYSNVSHEQKRVCHGYDN
jgi:hypothetical protein